MMPIDPVTSIHAEAIRWHLRLCGARADDWDAFVAWLAPDARHSDAYDEVALADGALDPSLAEWARTTEARTNDNAPIGRRERSRWSWLPVGGLAAAAAAAMLLIIPAAPPMAEYYTVATAPGEQRTVTLQGGATIALNGDTVLRLDRNNPRFASLDSGEAAFIIVHDAKAPFTLSIGDARLIDVGTRFNVIRTAAGHRVDVAEGAILYNAYRVKIALAAGQSLSSRTGASQAVVTQRRISEVGGWQHGRLSYRSAPLAQVGADLARSLGTPIAVQPAIASRSFTGTIEIDRDEDRLFARLAQLLDVDARRGPRGWTLGPAREPAR